MSYIVLSESNLSVDLGVISGAVTGHVQTHTCARGCDYLLTPNRDSTSRYVHLDKEKRMGASPYLKQAPLEACEASLCNNAND